MFQIATLNRFRGHLLIGAILAGIIVPAAGAITRPPDVQDTASANLAAQLRPPDIRDAALGSSIPVPDVVERYLTAHGYTGGLSQELSVPRPPDVTDAALAVQFSPVGESTGDFNWSDWAIGIGSGIGMMLILGAGLVTTRQVRQRPRTA